MTKQVSKVVKEMNKDHQGRPFEHPWRKWLSKRTILKREEYRATQESMCVMIRQNAVKFSLPVSVLPKEDGSIIIVPKKG